RAFLRTLIVLIAISVLAAIVGKAYGQERESKADTPNAPKVETKAEQPKPAAVVPVPVTTPVTAPVKKSEYQPTEIQRLKLENAQLRAVNAQQSWSAASMKLAEYQTFQSSVNSLVEECKNIERENRWPADVGCDINQNPIVFGKQPTAPAVVPATAK